MTEQFAVPLLTKSKLTPPIKTLRKCHMRSRVTRLSRRSITYVRVSHSCQGSSPRFTTAVPIHVAVTQGLLKIFASVLIVIRVSLDTALMGNHARNFHISRSFLVLLPSLAIIPSQHKCNIGIRFTSTPQP